MEVRFVIFIPLSLSGFWYLIDVCKFFIAAHAFKADVVASHGAHKIARRTRLS